MYPDRWPHRNNSRHNMGNPTGIPPQNKIGALSLWFWVPARSDVPTPPCTPMHGRIHMLGLLNILC
jgi:hypothetical protein